MKIQNIINNFLILKIRQINKLNMQRAVLEQSVDITQLHPYQYLTQLNSIYNSCNKANAKSYSSVSKIKLAWKPFSIMKIPNCFQVTYENTHKNDKQAKYETDQVMEQSQRRIWKDHEQIINRYFKNKENKGISKRPQTSMSYRNKNLNHHIVDDQSSRLIKRLTEKGVQITYDKQQVKEEVLKKLKNIETKKSTNQVWRAQSAINNFNKSRESKINEESLKVQSELNSMNVKPYICKQRKKIDEKDHLNYKKSSEIIASYKEKIKQVDCAISEKNIRKTAKILRNMQNIVMNNQIQ